MQEKIISESNIMCMKHSGFGIASFIIALFIIVFNFWLMIIVGTYGRSVARALNEDDVYTFFGALILSTYLINLIGIFLGIIGLLKKNRKKIFSILGVIINTFVMVVMILGI